MKLLLTKKQWIYVGTAIVVVIIGALYFCSPARAEEPKVNTFLALSARYTQDWGVGGGVTLQDNKSKMLFTLQVTYDQQDMQSGTAPYQVNPCLTVMVPWTYDPGGQTGIEFTLHIPLDKKK